MGVVNIDHKTDHGVPEQEGHQDPHQQCERDRLICGDSRKSHDADPHNAKNRDQQAVFEEDGTACRHVRFVGKEFTFPPNFNEVVKTRCPATAIKALQKAAARAQISKLFGSKRCPNKVDAF